MRKQKNVRVIVSENNEDEEVKHFNTNLKATTKFEHFLNEQISLPSPTKMMHFVNTTSFELNLWREYLKKGKRISR